MEIPGTCGGAPGRARRPRGPLRRREESDPLFGIALKQSLNFDFWGIHLHEQSLNDLERLVSSRNGLVVEQFGRILCFEQKAVALETST